MSRRRRKASVDAATVHFGADDCAEVDSLFAAVAHEHLAVTFARIAQRIQPLIERRVPVRNIDRAPTADIARVHFADGTIVMAHGAVPGDLGRLAAAMATTTVLPTSCDLHDDGAHVTMTWPHQRKVFWMCVTGLDQPD